MIVTDYSQFYKGTESITQYGKNADGISGKDTLVKYEFHTRDADGNVVMEKMSKEETLKVMHEITSQYGDNVMVAFSGDGLAKLVESKSWGARELTEEEKEAREIKNKAFQATIKQLEGTYTVLSPDQIKPVSDFHDIVRQQSPEWAAKMDDVWKRIINRQPGDHPGAEFLKLIQEAESIYGNYQNGQGKPVVKDYDALLGGKAGDYRAARGGKGVYTLNQRAEDLVRAYAELYLEIVTGYQSGERKSYKADETAENGYREMTMEEELAALDSAFDRQTSGIDEQVKRNDDLTKALKAYGEQLAKAKRNQNAEDVLEQYRERVSEQAKIPNDLAERMRKAVKQFKGAYAQSGSAALEELAGWV